jgi:AraC family transcriptional regulator
VQIDAERTALQGAVTKLGRIIDVAAPVESPDPEAGALLSERWTHGSIHAEHTALPAHVIMTYHGVAPVLEWRDGRQRQISRGRQGSITIIPRGHRARWDIEGPVSVSHVYLSHARLQDTADVVASGNPIELLDRIGFDDPVGSRIMDILALEATAPTKPRLVVDGALDLLCLHLIGAHSSLATPAPVAPRRGMPERQVRQVTEFMAAHLREDISLDQLAGVVGLSRFHFSTSFRRATGQTPYQWLTALRMARACELLRETGAAIAQVALQVGYDTPSAFAATFRRQRGKSPSAFRRESAPRRSLQYCP